MLERTKLWLISTSVAFACGTVFGLSNTDKPFVFKAETLAGSLELKSCSDNQNSTPHIQNTWEIYTDLA